MSALLTAPGSLVDSEGRIQPYGRYRGRIADVSTARWDRGRRWPRRTQRKAWIYASAFHEDFMVGYAVADAGYLGTGFVYDSNGFLLTNHHVIAKASEVTVRFLDGLGTALKDNPDDIKKLRHYVDVVVKARAAKSIREAEANARAADGDPHHLAQRGTGEGRRIGVLVLGDHGRRPGADPDRGDGGGGGAGNQRRRAGEHQRQPAAGAAEGGVHDAERDEGFGEGEKNGPQHWC